MGIADGAEISGAEARRWALAAQGLARPRPRGRVDVRHVRRVIADVGILQLDSVNVLSRAPYLPLFSRLGPYPPAAIDRLAVHGGDGGRAPHPERRELFEYWAHEASLLPATMQPLLRWRMARVDELAWSSIARIGRERPRLLEWVLGEVRERGPIRASELGVPRHRGSKEMWSWSEEKRALEHLFFAGRVARRRPPAASASPPSPTSATTSASPGATRKRGSRSWPRPASCSPSGSRVGEAGLPARERPPAAPATRRPRRPPLPLRLAGLVARARRARLRLPLPDRDLRAGGQAAPRLLRPPLPARRPARRPGRPESRPAGGVLRVQGAFAEPGTDPAATASTLAAELGEMAAWLELGGVAVGRRGDLARPLARALAPRRG